MKNALIRTGEFVGTGRGAGFLIGATLLTLFVLREFLFPGIGGDEGEQLIFSQYFDWGYQVRNPPLYTWLVIAVSSVLGPTVQSVIIIKFAALALAYVFLWKSALSVLQDERLAALSAASPLALYYVAWDSIYGYSHSVLVMMFYMATLWLVIRIAENRRTRDFIWLGFAIGGGLLSKYVFALFLVALLVAVGLDRDLRRNLFRLPILISLSIALVCIFPHLLWLIDNAKLPVEVGSHTFNFNGLIRLALAITGFLSPLWLVLAVLFTAAFKSRPSRGSGEGQWARLLERYFMVLGSIALIAVVSQQSDRLRTHYMFVLLPMIIYFFLRIKYVIVPLPRLHLYGGILVLFAATSVGGMVIKYIGEPFKCSRCQHHIPYAALAENLRRAGFRGGTIFAYWHPDPIAGNLRAQFSDSRVISAKHPKVQPPPRDRPGQCLLVWPITSKDTGRLTTIDMANRYLGTSLAANTPARQVDAPMVMGRGKRVRLGYILVDPGQGTCR